jgi:hypothetical protein
VFNFFSLREMQIKTILRFHLIQVRKENKQAKLKGMWGEVWTLLQLCWECKLNQPLCNSMWMFSKVLKQKCPMIQMYHFGAYSRRNLSQQTHGDTCKTVFMEAMFTKAKVWNQYRCPSMDELRKCVWIKENKITSSAESG